MLPYSADVKSTLNTKHLILSSACAGALSFLCIIRYLCIGPTDESTKEHKAKNLLNGKGLFSTYKII